MDSFSNLENKVAKFVNAASAEGRSKSIKRTGKYCNCDPLAIASALSKDRVMGNVEAKYCTVELNGHMTRSQVIVDWLNQADVAPNVKIVTDFNMEAFKEMYSRMMRWEIA